VIETGGTLDYAGEPPSYNVLSLGSGSTYNFASAKLGRIEASRFSPNSNDQLAEELKIDGSVNVTGDLDVKGDVSAEVKNFVQDINSTHEAVYTSQESPNPRAVVEGTARLKNGETSVELPNHFTRVSSDTRPEIKVQATPLSTDTYGIAVTRKATNKVRFEELMNGDSDIRFDYRVTAIRDGYEDQKVVREK
jgi:hypothetical protein